MSGERPGEMRIGQTLADARSQAGLDLDTAAERTKIRSRYLTALEEERWDELPSTAYGKGFLRSYADLLGLDSELLVDEYRRQVEAGERPSLHPLGDTVLEGRRRPSPRGPRTGLLAGIGVVVLGGAVIVIALTGSGGQDEAHAPAKPPAGTHGSRQLKPKGTVELALAIRSPVEVCLVGGGDEALIDGQVLGAGDHEHFERRRFELRFPKGFDPRALRVKLAGDERSLPAASGPAAYEIVAPNHIVKAGGHPREECP